MCRVDAPMQAGDIECGRNTKVKTSTFVKVENPGDDTYILALRLHDPPKKAPKRSRSGRRRRETIPEASGEPSREVADKASPTAETRPAEPTQMPLRDTTTVASGEPSREGADEASPTAESRPAGPNQVPLGNPPLP